MHLCRIAFLKIITTVARVVACGRVACKITLLSGTMSSGNMAMMRPSDVGVGLVKVIWL